MNINEAINQLKGGSKDAMKHIVYAYSHVLIRVASRYTRDLEEAKDVLQDSFIAIYQNINQLRESDEMSFLKWSKTIVVRTALRKYERLYFKNENQVIGPGTEGVQNQIAETNLNEQDIHNLIEELPAGYKLIFKLYVIEEYSHKEIADLLNIKASTSRSQYMRARKMMQEKLAESNKIHLS